MYQDLQSRTRHCFSTHSVQLAIAYVQGYKPTELATALQTLWHLNWRPSVTGSARSGDLGTAGCYKPKAFAPALQTLGHLNISPSFEGFLRLIGNYHVNERKRWRIHSVEIEATLKKEYVFDQGVERDEACPDDQDASLARRIAQGDVDAWNTFFDRFSPWAYRFAYRRLNGNKADAEDLCSDILMNAAKCIAKFDPSRGALDLWMHGIAKNRLARFCRSRRIELPLENDHPSPNQQIVFSEDFTDKTLMRDLVNRTLANLPERQVSVLIGKYVEGFSTEELARLSKTTPKAIESLLVRARTAFRSAFNGLINDEPEGGNSHE